MSLLTSSPHGGQTSQRIGVVATVLPAIPVKRLRELLRYIIKATPDTPITISTAELPLDAFNGNVMLSRSLYRVCLYLIRYGDYATEAALMEHLIALQAYPKPWGAQVQRNVHRPHATGNGRGVRDFNAGSLVGGHPTTGTPTVSLSLPELELFSNELAIVETLLPLYIEAT